MEVLYQTFSGSSSFLQTTAIQSFNILDTIRNKQSTGTPS